jgi:hypothetical protein
MPAKKHHYLSQFLLRRFAEPEAPRFIWRLDKKNGQTRHVPPKSQAAKHQYYRFTVPDGSIDPGFVEETLSRIESLAAAAIRRLVEGALEPSEEDRHALALFAVLQSRRTPAGRRQLRFFDEFSAKLQFEVSLSDGARFATRVREREPDMADDDVEALREQMLAELKSGDTVVESTPEREVGLMFMALDRIAPTLVTDFDWLAVEAPVGSEFVLSDVGIGHFDPTPPHAHAGSAWRSSPNSQTTMAIDRQLALVVTPGHGRWGRTMIDGEDVDDLNLRSYAVSEVCYFGSGQKVVCDLRVLAKRNAVKVARYRARPGRLWVTEVEGRPKTGVLDFTGHSTEGEVKARLEVDPQAFPRRR